MSARAKTKQNDERLSRVAVEIRAMTAKAKKAGNRGFTSDERERFARMEAAYAGMQGRNMNSASAPSSFLGGLREAYPDDKTIMATARDENIRQYGIKNERRRSNDVFSKYLREGELGLSSRDRQFLSHRSQRGETPGMPVPLGAGPRRIRAAQTLTTTSGGYLGAQGFSDMLEEALQWHGGILGVCGSFETANGNPLPWPTVNDTANEGRIIAVNTQATETDLTFGQIEFGAYIFSSDYVLVPVALIEDSYFDLDQYLAELLGKRLGRLLNKYCTVGNGTAQPTGLQTAVIASGNTVQGATGETTSLVYSDLVNVMELVDPSYRTLPTAGFMFADSTLKVIRKLVDTAGRPLWQPGLTAGFGQTYPETILDRPYFINNDLPAPAANAYSVLYGDFSRYKVRRVTTGTSVLRIGERWSDYLQVGYLAFLRADGNLVDAGTHPVSAFQQSAT